VDKDPVNVWLEKARLIGSIVILIATVGTTSVAFLYATFHTNSSAAADSSTDCLAFPAIGSSGQQQRCGSMQTPKQKGRREAGL